MHARFEGDSRPCGRLLKEKTERLALEQGVWNTQTLLLLEVRGERQQAVDFGFWDRRDVKQILGQPGSSL